MNVRSVKFNRTCKKMDEVGQEVDTSGDTHKDVGHKPNEKGPFNPTNTTGEPLNAPCLVQLAIRVSS